MSVRAPVTVIVAAALEAVEGLAAIGFGAFVGWETVAGEPVDPASAVGVAVFALLGGVGMLAVARALLRAEQRWSRAPAVLTQLFGLPIAWSLYQGEQYLIGVPLAAAAVVALVALLSPPTTTWLEPNEPEESRETSKQDS